MLWNEEIKRIWETNNIPLHLSYIYNTFIVRQNKRKTYFQNIYKTDLCDWNNWNFDV